MEYVFFQFSIEVEGDERFILDQVLSFYSVDGGPDWVQVPAVNSEVVREILEAHNVKIIEEYTRTF